MFTGFELQQRHRTDSGHHEGNVTRDAEIGRSTTDRASQRVVRRSTVREILAELFSSDRRLS